MRKTHSREFCAPVNTVNRAGWTNPNRIRCPKVGGRSFGHLTHLKMRKTVWGSFAHLRSNTRKTTHAPRCAHWPPAIPGACPHERCARRISPHLGTGSFAVREANVPAPSLLHRITPHRERVLSHPLGETQTVSPHCHTPNGNPQTTCSEWVGRNSPSFAPPEKRKKF
jgi:hypothetical protein